MRSNQQSNQESIQRHQRYIRIIERSPRDTEVLRCLILDEGLSIIKQSTDLIEMVCPEFKQEDDQSQQTLCTINKQAKKGQYTQISYRKYPFLKDFLIGRKHWGRQYQTIKIQSDSVSRNHTQIVCHSSLCDQQEYFNSIKEYIAKKTRISSKWRKISNQLIQKIAEYAIARPYYSIVDCNSRNGTFLIDHSVPIKTVKGSQAFRFQQQDYIINILEQSKSLGQQIFNQFQKYENRLERNFSQKNLHLDLIVPLQISRPDLFTSEEQFDLLKVQINVKHDINYEYWVIARQRSCFSIGEGQQLAMQYRPDSYQFKRHGTILFKNGQWLLHAIEGSIWTKLEPSNPQILTKQNYIIMIASYSVLELSFHHFQ